MTVTWTFCSSIVSLSFFFPILFGQTGLLTFYKKNEGYLQGQIGNPEGDDKPNKSYYDPRKWVRRLAASSQKWQGGVVGLNLPAWQKSALKIPNVKCLTWMCLA